MIALTSSLASAPPKRLLRPLSMRKPSLRVPAQHVDHLGSQDEGNAVHTNPRTGSPNTNVPSFTSLELASFAAVCLFAFWSMWNVRDVVGQVRMADMHREPAAKMEWARADNQKVYGPCGDMMDPEDAAERMLDQSPCPTSAYNRLAPGQKPQAVQRMSSTM